MDYVLLVHGFAVAYLSTTQPPVQETFDHDNITAFLCHFITFRITKEQEARHAILQVGERQERLYKATRQRARQGEAAPAYFDAALLQVSASIERLRLESRSVVKSNIDLSLWALVIRKI